MKRLILFFSFIIFAQQNFAQDTFLKDVLKANREKLYRNLVNNTINNNLSFQLTDSTEDQWQNAFSAMELIHYNSPWTENRIRTGMHEIQNRSILFQRAILELIYANYPDQYNNEVKTLLEKTNDVKIFAMCAVYLLKNNKERSFISGKVNDELKEAPDDPFLRELYQLTAFEKNKASSYLYEFLEKKWLPGNVLLISFQRQNRNYPGLVMVKDTNGNFIKEVDGSFFAVPQLARSISNLPGFLTNGNTPEGIFRMDGFDNSKSSFIGPTTNVQLTMPFEFKASHFYKDSTLADSVWNIDLYKNLLPKDLKDDVVMLQSYYAGKAGRTEIIAHGTAIDPNYYKGTPWYPLTPTVGCLCTKEIWSETTGKLIESDQQKLSNAIAKAGGPNGYAVVINIDDKQEPVSINDIIPLLNLAMQK